MTPARPVIRVILLLSYSYTIQATYGHSSEYLIDGSWKDILLSSLSDGCLAQCHGMLSFLITDLLRSIYVHTPY